MPNSLTCRESGLVSRSLRVALLRQNGPEGHMTTDSQGKGNVSELEKVVVFLHDELSNILGLLIHGSTKS